MISRPSPLIPLILVQGSLSPEARVAVDVFNGSKSDTQNRLLKCSSGKELWLKDYAKDVVLASDLDSDTSTPILIDKAYRTP
ncbi:MAG: hypothetical protein ABIH42_04395 [Planctomycetota bacterium]